MNYLETFKPAVDAEVGTLAKTVSTLTDQLPKIKKRLEDERNKVARIEGHIRKLKSEAGSSLTADDSSYEKYKVALRKNTTERETAVEVVTQLQSEIIPKLESDLKLASTNLKNKLAVLMRETRPVADKVINELIIAALAERENYLDAWREIYWCFGQNLVVNDEGIIPSPWSCAEVKSLERVIHQYAPLGDSEPEKELVKDGDNVSK